MRDYGTISSAYWTGETGRRLREFGRDAQALGAFLITGPDANAIGLYYLPKAIIAHYLAWDVEGVSDGLQKLAQVNFALYDDSAEEVWVREMAYHQLRYSSRPDQPLKPSDKIVKHVLKEWKARSKSVFFLPFYERYRELFHLPEAVANELASKGLRRVIEGAPEG